MVVSDVIETCTPFLKDIAFLNFEILFKHGIFCSGFVFVFVVVQCESVKSSEGGPPLAELLWWP